MSHDFAWGEADIVIRGVAETTVYENVNGDVVIRQRASFDDDVDPLVVIPIDRLPEVIVALQEVARTAQLRGGREKA